MPEHLFPTTVVGGYPQPVWPVDEAALKATRVPRVRRALPFVSPERRMPAPDGGLKHLTRRRLKERR